MRNYIIRRLLLMIPTILLVSLISFFMVHLIPGDIIDTMGVTDPTNPLDRPALEHQLGLDAPAIVQYGRWLGVVPQMDGSFSGVFEGDFGKSWYQQAPVLELLAGAWPVTFELGLIALIVAQLIALPIGIYSALRQDTWGDYIGRTFAILCISVPAF
jgi:peptide/nickel transport system permease protein